MITEYITLEGFILAVFIAGITVGRLAEKIERFIRENENYNRRSKRKNDRR